MLLAYVMNETQSSPIPWQVWLFILAGIVIIVWPSVAIANHYRRLRQQPEEKTEPEYTELVARATVEELSCWVHTIGYKTPKTNQVFAVTFRLDSGEEKTLRIPEEMYHGLEEKQVGIVTIRDGELYGFELE